MHQFIVYMDLLDFTRYRNLERPMRLYSRQLELAFRKVETSWNGDSALLHVKKCARRPRNTIEEQTHKSTHFPSI